MSLFSLIAFLIPFPLFFDLSSGSFVLHPIEYNKIMISAGTPVPIALLGLVLIILLSSPRVLRLRLNRDVAIALSGLALFCFIELPRLAPIRLFSVAVPVLLILGACSVAAQPVIAEKISRGYLAGLLCQSLLHVASMFFYSLGREDIYSASRTFFGYEIYQAMLSYSAIFSAAGAAMLIAALAPKNKSRRLLLLALATPAYLIVICATRKAALADMAFVFLINAFLMLRSVRFPEIYKVERQFLQHAFIFTVLTTMLCLAVIYSPRDLRVGTAVADRSSNYENVLAALPNLRLSELLIGYEPGWGGYSNLFVELFVRSGLIGMTAYLLGLVMAFRRFYLALFVPAGEAALALRADIYVKCWFTFALASFLVGNLANVNLHLPYYAVNFIMINICFIFFYSRSGEFGRAGA